MIRLQAVGRCRALFSGTGSSRHQSAASAAAAASAASAARLFHSTAQTASSRIAYRIAVSASGKGRRFHPVKNTYTFDPAVQDALGIGHKTKRGGNSSSSSSSGEDAFFVSKVGGGGGGGGAHQSAESGAVAFGVADGVGGWAESRVDPADFSHGLCSYMARAALDWTGGAETLRAKTLLQMGYDQVVRDESISAGGSTASVGVALGNGRVELANLGDSGSVLLRLAAVHHYSTPQTHGFNTPYQLSLIPPRMRAQASIFGGSFFEDQPRDAASTVLHMQHGDVLVLATDGVFDNLNNQDILKLVVARMLTTGAWAAPLNLGVSVSSRLDCLTRPSPSAASSASASTPLQTLLASAIAGEAKLASVDARRDGPFAKEAQRYYPGDWFRGGKVDDICVLVVVAVEQP